jgi:hypothetical protein
MALTAAARWMPAAPATRWRWAATTCSFARAGGCYRLVCCCTDSQGFYTTLINIFLSASLFAAVIFSPGSNSHGQLGIAGRAAVVPAEVLADGAIAVACGQHHSAASEPVCRVADARRWCWRAATCCAGAALRRARHASPVSMPPPPSLSLSP